ncbi:hypothetical protein VTO42DRAFT_6674 [Malbranchea cinnamomea]
MLPLQRFQHELLQSKPSRTQPTKVHSSVLGVEESQVSVYLCNFSKKSMVSGYCALQSTPDNTCNKHPTCEGAWRCRRPTQCAKEAHRMIRASGPGPFEILGDRGAAAVFHHQCRVWLKRDSQ